MKAIHTYSEEDFLQLSGIQHFVFCRRQWALIAIEQTWIENYLTLDGRILHEKAHADVTTESRGDVLITRGLPVHSRILGLSGICDVVEFQCSESGVTLHGREGYYRPLPVEYKRGMPKQGDEDIMQLAAQCICLEEMLLLRIPQAHIYYGKSRHRIIVEIDEVVRGKLINVASEMHSMWEQASTPKAKYEPKCDACSLYDICLPKTISKKIEVSCYVDENLFR